MRWTGHYWPISSKFFFLSFFITILTTVSYLGTFNALNLKGRAGLRKATTKISRYLFWYDLDHLVVIYFFGHPRTTMTRILVKCRLT
jgi:hypothetical protein